MQASIATIASWLALVFLPASESGRVLPSARFRVTYRELQRPAALGHVLHLDVAFPLDGGHDIGKLQFLVETKQTF